MQVYKIKAPMLARNRKLKHPFESFISKLPFSDCDAKNQANKKPAITKQAKKVILINHYLSQSPRVSRLIFLLRVRDLLITQPLYFYLKAQSLTMVFVRNEWLGDWKSLLRKN